MMPDIESFYIIRDALQVLAMLAVRQSKKSAEVCQLKEEIAKLCSNLTNSISGQVEGGNSLRSTNSTDPKTISLIVCFPTIYKKHFEDILYIRFKPKNILKLSTSFITIKPHVKYIKLGDNIELATHQNNSTASEAKNIIQLVQSFLLYMQIIIYFAPFLVQLELSSALATYIDRLLGHFIFYT